MLRRTVHQVPIVDILGMAQIQVVNGLFFFFIAFGEFLYQKQQREQAFFVKFRHQQPPGFFQVKVLEFPDVLSEDRNANAQESISFAVFSFSGFKKPLGMLRDTGIGQAFQDVTDLFGSHLFRVRQGFGHNLANNKTADSPGGLSGSLCRFCYHW
jgi:hypothetical protein